MGTKPVWDSNSVETIAKAIVNGGYTTTIDRNGFTVVLDGEKSIAKYPPRFGKRIENFLKLLSK